LLESQVDIAALDLVEPSTKCSPREQISQEIALIFQRVKPGTVEGAVLAHAVYDAAGLPESASPTVDQLGHKPFLALACANILVGVDNSPALFLDHEEQIVALCRDLPKLELLQPGLSDKLETLLTCLAVLQFLKPGEFCTEPIDARIVAPLIKERELGHVEALVRMFEPSPRPEQNFMDWPALMIIASAQARPPGADSVLTIPTGRGDCLGWVVARQLADSLRFERTDLKIVTFGKITAIKDDSEQARARAQVKDLFDGINR